MKFFKKAIVIEAEQFWASSEIWPDGVYFDPKHEHAVQSYQGQVGHFVIWTLEGLMEVNPGDWIITGIAGERYPCKQEIFEKTYTQIAANDYAWAVTIGLTADEIKSPAAIESMLQEAILKLRHEVLAERDRIINPKLLPEAA